MIPMTFALRKDKEKEIVVNQYLEALRLDRHSEKMRLAWKLCKEHLSDVQGRDYSLEDLVKATPNELKVISEFLSEKHWDDADTKIIKEVFIEYLYKRMPKKARETLVNGLGLSVCPYCNHNYVFATNETSFCDLDHFYPKSNNPFLAISFYNLIPSCHVCNHKKLDTFFSFYPHDSKLTHEDIMSFEVIPKDVGFIEGKYDSFDIAVKANQDIYQTQIDKLKLSILYNKHKGEAAEIINRRLKCSDQYLSDLCKEFHEVFTNPVVAEEIIYGTTFDPRKFEKVPLSKFKNDIYHMFG